MPVHPDLNPSGLNAPSDNRETPLTLSMGYLGPSGSHSHQALLTFCKRYLPDANLAPHEGLLTLMQACAAGALDAAIVPVENLLEGSVIEVIETIGLQKEPITPVLEWIMPIEHCLIGPQGAVARDIQRVLSHPQALGQCKQTLEALCRPKLQFEPTPSTSDAVRQLAQFVQSNAATGVAAIGTRIAAQAYDLAILSDNVSDIAENQTRFWLVTRRDAAARLKTLFHGILSSDKLKTSLCIAVIERAGALADMLAGFKAVGVSLSKLESRPSRKQLGDYYFYMDADGDLSAPAYEAMMRQLASSTAYCHLAGVYASLGLLAS
ncbi:MAG: prephenate dehydratase domain-containing protein [Vampirovibrionales bacterium]|nr:prephenate dehydratase domain-containing protein [Vampirovibrionales bacterium]